jgi:hypothetical protein
MAELGEPPATPAHRHPTLGKPPLYRSEPGLEVLQAALLGEPLRRRGIPSDLVVALASRNLKPRPDPTARAAQPHPGIAQVGIRAAPLIIRRAGDRPAQRLDAAAVSARFRSARRSSPPPSRQRTATAAPASRPRCPPTARNTRSSAPPSRSRVRTRAPDGGATTNGTAIGRISR